MAISILWGARGLDSILSGDPIYEGEEVVESAASVGLGAAGDEDRDAGHRGAVPFPHLFERLGCEIEADRVAACFVMEFEGEGCTRRGVDRKSVV